MSIIGEEGNQPNQDLIQAVSDNANENSLENDVNEVPQPSHMNESHEIFEINSIDELLEAMTLRDKSETKLDFQQLVGQGASFFDNSNQSLALRMAAQYGHPEVVEVAVSTYTGVHDDLKPELNNCIGIAIEYGQRAVVASLYAAGAQVPLEVLLALMDSLKTFKTQVADLETVVRILEGSSEEDEGIAGQVAEGVAGIVDISRISNDDDVFSTLSNNTDRSVGAPTASYVPNEYINFGFDDETNEFLCMADQQSGQEAPRPNLQEYVISLLPFEGRDKWRKDLKQLTLDIIKNRWGFFALLAAKKSFIDVLTTVKMICAHVDKDKYYTYIRTYLPRGRDANQSILYGYVEPTVYKRKACTDFSKFYRGMLAPEFRLHVNAHEVNYEALKDQLLKKINVPGMRRDDFNFVVEHLVEDLVWMRWGIIETTTTRPYLPAMDETSESQPLHRLFLLHILYAFDVVEDALVTVSPANSKPKLTYSAQITPNKSVKLSGYLDLVAHPPTLAAELTNITAGVEVKIHTGAAAAGSRGAQQVRDQCLLENEALNSKSRSDCTVVVASDFFVSFVDVAFSITTTDPNGKEAKNTYHIQSARTTKAEEVVLLYMLVLFPLDLEQWVHVFSGGTRESVCLDALKKEAADAASNRSTSSRSGINGPSNATPATKRSGGGGGGGGGGGAGFNKKPSASKKHKSTSGSATARAGKGPSDWACVELLSEAAPLKSCLSAKSKRPALSAVSANVVAARSVVWATEQKISV